MNRWDLALFKNFVVAAGKHLQFRGKFFNTVNHPSFDTVGVTLTTGTTVNPGDQQLGVVTERGVRGWWLKSR